MSKSMVEYEMEVLEGSAEKSAGVRPGSLIDEQVSPAIWDDSVTSIISDGKNHTVFIHSGIIEAIEYNKLVYFLDMLGKKDIVKLRVSNGGGNLDSALLIRNAIQESKAKVIGIAGGTVASAATLILLSCDELVVHEHISWLSHNYSASSGGKGAELKARQEFDEKVITKMFMDIHNGFFTGKEMEEIMADKDYWLDKAEIDKRWKKMQKVRGKK